MTTPSMTSNGIAGDGGLVRSFSTFEHAEAAKTAVLSFGVSPDAVQLQALQDEAGPVEGNFLVGNGRVSPDKSAYESNFANAVAHGSCLLVLSAIPDGRRSEIEAALNELGGVNIDAVANRGNSVSPKNA